MAKQSISPSTVAVDNITNLPSLVVGQSATLQPLFDKSTLDNKTYINNTLIAELNGDDGSKKIGHDSLNITSDNVADAIEEVRQIAVDAQAGTIIDGSITDAKLSNAPTDIKATVSNFTDQYEYQTPMVVAQEIQVVKPSSSNIIKFQLTSAITGGAITISIDGGATSKPLVDIEEVAIEELEKGFYEVIADATFFTLRPSGSGLKEFFGNGSDGTIPDLNLITTAPNGGIVANLWDMNAGTVFTTGILSSASDQVVFEIDFGKPMLIGGSGNSGQPNGYRPWMWRNTISTGATRTMSFEYSDDNINWTSGGTSTVTTTIGDDLFQASASPIHRYWRLVLKAGGSDCTLSSQGFTINYNTDVTGGSTDNQLNKIWRIVEPSTLNGGAVIKQYTEYTLPIGYEHTVQNPCQGLVIYSQGNITVNGVIDMSQKAGLAPNGNAIPMLMTNFKATDPYGIEIFNQLTTNLLLLKGGAGGNGGYGGGYSGATGRQTSVGIGGAGRQNLGGFGGGGSGGSSGVGVAGIGGSIQNDEIGGGQSNLTTTGATTGAAVKANGINGSGAIGDIYQAVAAKISGFAFGGGSGGVGCSRTSSIASNSSNSEYSGGLILLIAKSNVTNNGTVRANGGDGSDGTSGASGAGGAGGGGGGGGAGGGVIAFAHKGTYTNNGTAQANGGAGGTGGAGAGGGEAGGTATSGSVGTIADIQL